MHMKNKLLVQVAHKLLLLWAVGPLLIVSLAGFDAWNGPINKAYNLNTAAPASPPAGTILQAAGPDGVAARFLVEGFGANPSYSCRRADTSGAAPSAVQLNEVVCEMLGFGYGATGYGANARGKVSMTATEAWTDAAQGTKIVLQTTGTGGTTLGTPMTLTAGAQVGAPTGGDCGVGCVNATDYKVNNASLTGTANALMTGGGAGVAPNFVALTGLVMGNGASAPTGLAFAHTQSSVAAPTGTANATGLMMGLAGTVTPTATGKVRISVCGDIINNTIGSGSNVQLRTGTGTAPVNTAALTGTTRGSLVKFVASTATGKVPFCVQYTVTGLTLSTAVWIDVGLAAVTSGTATIADVDIVADELP